MKKGFTLIEVVITLAIMLTVMSIIFPIFSSNTKLLSETEIKSDLQGQGEQIMTYVSKAGFETEKISLLIDDLDADKLKSYDSCRVKQISFSTDDNVTHSFKLESGVLKYTKTQVDINGTTTTIINNREIAKDIDYIEINPIKSGVNYDTCNGIHLKINFLVKKGNSNVSYSTESDIYFRNVKAQGES